MIRAAMFDLDGTLVETKRLYLECYRRALAGTVGRFLSDEELLAMNRGPTSETAMLRRHVHPDQLDACLARFYEDYEALHDSHFDGIYSGVAVVLNQLRAADVKLAIITGKSRRAWSIMSARVELGAFD